MIARYKWEPEHCSLYSIYYNGDMVLNLIVILPITSVFIILLHVKITLYLMMCSFMNWQQIYGVNFGHFVHQQDTHV